LKGALTAGVRSGTVLAVLAVLFAILGLTPSLSWIPEAPLLAVAAVGPIFLLGGTGYRLGKDSWMAAIAGATAGAIGGCVGGLAYLAYGKSALNVAAGTIAGAAAGAVLGAAGAVVARSRE